MVHELQEGSQSESQHFTVAEEMKNAVTRDLVARREPAQAELPLSPDEKGSSLELWG